MTWAAHCLHWESGDEVCCHCDLRFPDITTAWDSECPVSGGSDPNQPCAPVKNANERTPCPTCSGPIRETVGMVCPTCGTDYSLPAGPSS